ncbi:MAG: hypothetical protein NUV97_02045 [archaeon]|nr:hypothetical protein [archaeon]MCR4323733.1 hypothetical protein [Nanoarchaeota archaeon]
MSPERDNSFGVPGFEEPSYSEESGFVPLPPPTEEKSKGETKESYYSGIKIREYPGGVTILNEKIGNCTREIISVGEETESPSSPQCTQKETTTTTIFSCPDPDGFTTITETHTMMCSPKRCGKEVEVTDADVLLGHLNEDGSTTVVKEDLNGRTAEGNTRTATTTKTTTYTSTESGGTETSESASNSATLTDGPFGGIIALTNIGEDQFPTSCW